MKSILPTLGMGLALCLPAFAQTPAAGSAPFRITLQDAMERARKYSQQTFTANVAALLAHEDTVQAKAALLPSVNGISQFIYRSEEWRGGEECTSRGRARPSQSPH